MKQLTGLADEVDRCYRNLEGQLQVESKVNEGSKFTFILPFRLAQLDSSPPGQQAIDGPNGSGSDSQDRVVVPGAERDPLVRRRSKASTGSRTSAESSGCSDIDSLINAMSSSHMDQQGRSPQGPHSASSRSSRSALSFRTAHSGQSGAPSSSAVTPFLNSFDRGKKDKRGEMVVKDAKTPLRASRLSSDHSAEPTSSSSPMQSPGHVTDNPLDSAHSQSFGGAASSFQSPPPLSPSAPLPRSVNEQPFGPPTRPSPAHPPSIEDHTPRPSTPTSPRKAQEGFSSSHSAISSSQSAVSSSRGAPSSHSGSGSNTSSLRHVSEFRKGSISSATTEGIPKMRVLVVEDEVSTHCLSLLLGYA